MTEYFVRNITRVCLPETYYKIFALSLFYPVQRTLCHSEELRCNDVRIPRKGTILQNPRKILLYLRRGKGAHKQKSEHYRPDNAISKVQCAPWGNDNTTAIAVVLSFDVFRIKELWIVICVNFGERKDFRPVRRVDRRVVRPVRRSTARRLP